MTAEKTATTGKLSTRNLFMFSLGTIGRDFTYQLFNSYLITYILFTKTLTDAQFASVSIIIVIARIFDAFNDPVMGGIVENTRTRFGKFKPWIFSGILLTGGVVIGAFSTDLQGWSFIGYLAFIYLSFSITYTMNDISYWGMLPSLTKNEYDRSKLTSVAQLCGGIGGGLVGVLVPVFTTGQWAIGGNAVTAFRWVAVIAALLMVGFQMFTVFGVREEPLPLTGEKAKRMSVKDMFKTILKNDQLLWAALIILIFNVGTNVVGGGLSMSYIYFEFGYNGLLTTLFGILYAVFSALVILLYPRLTKKFGRGKLAVAGAFAIMIGYIIMLIFGLALPTNPWWIKFGFLVLGNGVVGFGQSTLYTVLVISVANTVEYNEWKTGHREEGLIFSVRPFTAKLGSALMQFVVMLVYLIVGVTAFTNRISDVENAANKGLIDEAVKMEQIQAVISSVPNGKKMALLSCMCLIPIAFIAVAILLYRKKYRLTEEFHRQILKEIDERNALKQTDDGESEN